MQLALNGPDGVAAIALLDLDDQLRPRLLTHGTVGGQAMGSLKVLNRDLRQRAEIAINSDAEPMGS
jgi:hypothetical protein